MTNRLEIIAGKAQKAISESNGTNVPSFNHAIKELAEAVGLMCIELGEIKRNLNELKK